MDGEDEGEALRDEPAAAALFAVYRDGFDDFDAESIADCFAFPVTIWPMGRGNVFLDRDELLENVDVLLDVLEREEVVRSSFDIIDVSLEETTGFALLDWRQERGDEEVALAYSCHYTLIRDGGGAWKIALVVNE